MSKVIEDKILDYITKKNTEKNGYVTKNDIVDLIKGDLSKPPTFKLLNKLEKEEKINVSKGKRKGQAHYLSINDKNKSNQIKEQLSRIQKLIKEINQYLQRRSDENNYDIELAENYEDNDKEIKLDKRIDCLVLLEIKYKSIITRMLEDLYYLTTTSNLSREDSERFLKEIIELKLQLAYHPWSKDIEKRRFKIEIFNVNNLVRRFEKDGLEDYIEGKLVKNSFAEPLIHMINDFKDHFLS